MSNAQDSTIRGTDLALAPARGAAHARRKSVARELHRSGAVARRGLAAARDRGDRVLVPRAAREHAIDDEGRRNALPRLLSIRVVRENGMTETYGDFGPDLAEPNVDVASERVRDQEHDAHRSVRGGGLNHQCSNTGIQARCGVAHRLAHGAREHRQAEDDHERKQDIEGDLFACRELISRDRDEEGTYS